MTTSNETERELFLDVKALGDMAYLHALELYEDGGNRDPNGRDIHDEVVFGYGGLAELLGGNDDPRWSHLHRLRKGLLHYRQRVTTNQEAVAGYGPPEVEEFEASIVPVIDNLLARIDAAIEPMFNNVDYYDDDELPEDRVARLLQAATAAS